MSYKKAANILPLELLEQIQQYVNGECIYIPRIADQRQKWGERTSIRVELQARDEQIYSEYLTGVSLVNLSEKHYLSMKSIQRIIRNMKLRHK